MVKMKVGFHTGTTMSSLLTEDLTIAKKCGWQWLEVPFRKIAMSPKKELERLIAEVSDDVKIAAVDIHNSLLQSSRLVSKESLQRFRLQCKLCKMVNADIVVMSPVQSQTKHSSKDFETLVNNLNFAAKEAAKEGIKLAVEFLKYSSVVNNLNTALYLIREAGQPNVGCVIDIFHFWNGPSKLEDIYQIKTKELFLVHLSDTNSNIRELVAEKDRLLPGEGILPIKKIIQQVLSLGHNPFFIVEAPSRHYWHQPAFEVSIRAFNTVKKLCL